jgi:hypothetical protein
VLCDRRVYGRIELLRNALCCVWHDSCGRVVAADEPQITLLLLACQWSQENKKRSVWAHRSRHPHKPTAPTGGRMDYARRVLVAILAKTQLFIKVLWVGWPDLDAAAVTAICIIGR